MTTVVNPSGTPTVIYSQSGTTIDTITGGISALQVDAISLVRYSERTVVLVNSPNSGSSSAVQLPANADIGDVFEIVGGFATLSGQNKPSVYVPSGMTANGQLFGGYSYAGAVWRYIATNAWVVVSVNP